MKYISLFSGIEAATVAWQTLGWEPVAYAEIEPFPKAVLKHHYPNVPDLGDMTKVNWKEYHHAADVVVGGSPCQAFSIAGLRKALDDPRGQLMLEYLRACAEIKYCYRWRDKNGVEDLKKALWYAKHAIDNNVPFLAMYLGPDSDIITARPIRLLGILEAENWADLEPFWNEIKWGCYKKAVKVLADKINEIEKDGE